MTRTRRPLALAPLRAEWLIVDGRPVFHRLTEMAGEDAPAIVHVHGFGISGTYMQPTAAILAPRFRTFIPDLPGHGRSMRLEGKLDLPRLAAALDAYCDAVGVKSATFVGNSLGCPVICALAAEFPDRIERAILVSPAGGPNNQPLPKALGQMMLDGPREPLSMVPIAVRDYLHFGVVTSLSLFAAMTRFPTIDRLHQLHVPTLAIVGQRDPPRRRPAGVRLRRDGPRERGRGAWRPRAELQPPGGDRRAHRRSHRRNAAAHRFRPPRSRAGNYTVRPLVMPAT